MESPTHTYLSYQLGCFARFLQVITCEESGWVAVPTVGDGFLAETNRLAQEVQYITARPRVTWVFFPLGFIFLQVSRCELIHTVRPPQSKPDDSSTSRYPFTTKASEQIAQGWPSSSTFVRLYYFRFFPSRDHHGLCNCRQIIQNSHQRTCLCPKYDCG
jgi:hypothetical protein